MDISIIIPVYNEVEALAPLYRELTDVLGGLEKSAEIFFIDDGSRDGSAAVLDELALSDARVQVLHLRRPGGWRSVTNFGSRAVPLPPGTVVAASAPLEGTGLDCGVLPPDTTAWVISAG